MGVIVYPREVFPSFKRKREEDEIVTITHIIVNELLGYTNGKLWDVEETRDKAVVLLILDDYRVVKEFFDMNLELFTKIYDFLEKYIDEFFVVSFTHAELHTWDVWKEDGEYIGFFYDGKNAWRLGDYTVFAYLIDPYVVVPYGFICSCRFPIDFGEIYASVYDSRGYYGREEISNGTDALAIKLGRPVEFRAQAEKRAICELRFNL